MFCRGPGDSPKISAASPNSSRRFIALGEREVLPLHSTVSCEVLTELPARSRGADDGNETDDANGDETDVSDGEELLSQVVASSVDGLLDGAGSEKSVNELDADVVVDDACDGAEPSFTGSQASLVQTPFSKTGANVWFCFHISPK